MTENESSYTPGILVDEDSRANSYGSFALEHNIRAVTALLVSSSRAITGSGQLLPAFFLEAQLGIVQIGLAALR